MGKGLAFWVLMIIWFVFGMYWSSEDARAGKYGGIGGNVMLFILLFLLGWGIFGFVIQ